MTRGRPGDGTERLRARPLPVAALFGALIVLTSCTDKDPPRTTAEPTLSPTVTAPPNRTEPAPRERDLKVDSPEVDEGWRELFATRSHKNRTVIATVPLTSGPLEVLLNCVGPGRVEVEALPVATVAMPCPAGEVSRYGHRLASNGARRVTVSVNASPTVRWKLSIQQRRRSHT